MSKGQTENLHQSGLEASIAQILHTHIDEMALCPDGWVYPSEDFDDEVREVVFPLLQRLAKGRAVETRTVTEEHKNWEQHREYRLTAHARETIESTLENRDSMMPCGHSGLSNCGDHFVCTFELCSEEFQREELNV